MTKTAEEFKPFSEDWERDVMKMRKADIVQFLKQTLFKLNILESHPQPSVQESPKVPIIRRELLRRLQKAMDKNEARETIEMLESYIDQLAQSLPPRKYYREEGIDRHILVKLLQGAMKTNKFDQWVQNAADTIVHLSKKPIEPSKSITEEEIAGIISEKISMSADKFYGAKVADGILKAAKAILTKING